MITFDRFDFNFYVFVEKYVNLIYGYVLEYVIQQAEIRWFLGRLLETCSSPLFDFKSLDLVPRPSDSLIFLDFEGPCLILHFGILWGLRIELSGGGQ